jgi:hypothetical protein
MERSMHEIAAELMETISECGLDPETGIPNVSDTRVLNDFSLIAILSLMYPNPDIAEVVMSN